MKTFIKLTTITLILAFTNFGIVSAANAGIYIEPFIGYEMGETDDGSEKADTTGNSFGARLGYSVLGFAFGGEYSTGAATAEFSSGDVDLDFTDMGAFVSYEFPVFLRVFATMFFDSTVEVPGDELTGDGSRIGVGFTGLPFIVINLEKVTREYDESSSGPANVSVDATMISVSIPLP